MLLTPHPGYPPGFFIGELLVFQLGAVVDFADSRFSETVDFVAHPVAYSIPL